MDMDTLLCLTWRTNEDLLDNTGNSAQSSVITLWSPGGRMGEGIVRESGMDVSCRDQEGRRGSEEAVPGPRCYPRVSRFSRVRLCATPYTAAHQAPPSLAFSRQERWSGLPFNSRGERGPLLPLEARPDSPGESGMQTRDPCLPLRGILGPG